MKKLLFIIFLFLNLSGISQVVEYTIRGNISLVTDSMIVIGNDTLYGTTQIDGTDTVFVTLDYLEAELATKINTSYTVYNIADGIGFLKNDGTGIWSYDNSTYDNYDGWTLYYPSGSSLIGSGIGVTVSEGTNMSIVKSAGNNLIFNSSEVDGSITNELDNTDNQTLSFTSPNLSIAGGNSVNLSGLRDITGTGTSGQVTYWNGTSSITGSSAFTFNGTNVTSTGTFTGTNFILSSDRRLKTGIQPIDELNWVDKIDFVKFSMKADSTHRTRAGVIAQAVEKIAPELVYTDEEGIKSVGYTDLIIFALQNQKEKIINLEKTISNLIKRIEKLENEK
jgi:hypothetical protein